MASLPAEPQGKPKNTAVGSLSLLQWIFPAQKLNWGLLHCRRIFYHLSYQVIPNRKKVAHKISAALYFKQNVVFVCIFTLWIPKLAKEVWKRVKSSIGKRNNIRLILIFCCDGVTSFVDGKSNRHNISSLQEGFTLLSKICS